MGTGSGYQVFSRRSARADAAGMWTCLGLALVVALAGCGTQSAAAPPLRSGPTAPPGEQVVSYRGIQIFVPASWNPHSPHPELLACGDDQRDTYIIEDGGGSPTCGFVRDPTVTVARLMPLDEREQGIRQLTAHATTKVVVDGHEAWTGSFSTGPLTTVVEYVPDQRALLAVEGPDPSLSERIRRSLAVIDVDANGCRSHINAEPQPSGSDVTAPEAVQLCRYTAGWLSRSARLTGAAADAFALELAKDRPPVRSTALPCQDAISRPILVTLTTASADQTLVAHLTGCYPSIDFPDRKLGLDRSLFLQLARNVDYNGGVMFPAA